MSSARVYSIELLDQFSRDLQKFRLELLKELESLDLELRRLTAWVTQDCRHYWQAEQQLASRRLSEYQQQLSRCMSYVRESERRPCTEEKKRVAWAKQRLQLCEQKLQAVQAASNHWQAVVSKTVTKLQRCRDMAESDLLVARNQLEKLLDQLRSYAQLVTTAVPRTDGHGAEQSLQPGDTPVLQNEPLQADISRSVDPDSDSTASGDGDEAR
jgi:hypothetical protein